MPRPVLRVSTADNVAVGWDLAGVGSRIAAQLIDGLIVAVAEFVVLVVFVAVAQSANNPTDATAAVLGAVGAVLVVNLGYFTVFEIATGGRTPGKSTVGIRVMSANGGTPTVGQFVIRNVARLLDYLLYIGAVVMFFDKRSRRIGDILAGTVVVHAKQQVTFASAIAPPPVILRTPDAGPAVDHLARLGPQELNALRTFLSRPGLDPALRSRLAGDIAARMFTRLDLPAAAPERQWPAELFLERLYMQLQKRH